MGLSWVETVVEACLTKLVVSDDAAVFEIGDCWIWGVESIGMEEDLDPWRAGLRVADVVVGVRARST